MLCIPGQPGKDLCDRHLGVTRRDMLRVGGSAVLGLTLGGMLKLQAAKAATASATSEPQGGGPGWGKAKSVILVYLQGGPSHLDLWDPKDERAGQRHAASSSRSPPRCRAWSTPSCCRSSARSTTSSR